MKVKVKMNQSALKRLSASQLQALQMTGEAVKTEVMTAGVVPKQTGELERSAFVDETKLRHGEVKLVFDTPYARRLYWHPEYDFRTDKNPNAQGRWLDAWVTGSRKDFAKMAFRKFYRGITGGVVR